MRSVYAVATFVLTAASALGQPYQVQSGNVLDRNPQLGSAGLNAPGRQYPINSTNRLLTGNMTGAADFRGFTPISDPSSFGLANGGVLPSDRLFQFRRDTVSIGDFQQGRTSPFIQSPYYSTSSAITNTGAIVNGLNRPGTSQVLSPYVVPRADLRSRRRPPRCCSRSIPGL